MRDSLQDIRYALRSLSRTPPFTGAVVLTLGLGIGVVTALFAVTDAVLLRPIVPSRDPVVRVWKHDVERKLERHPLAYAEFITWRDEAKSFQALAAINYADSGPAALMVDGRSAAVAVTPVSADFFSVVHGGEPLYGRWFQAADERTGAELVAVVSERFWRRAAGNDPGFVGRRLQWAGGQRTIVVVGIAPGEIDYPIGTDIWVPVATYFNARGGPLKFDIESRTFAQFELVGRLRSSASTEQARAELMLIHRRLASQFPADYRPMQVVVRPLLDTVVGEAKPVLLFLLAGAGLVFAIAGVNAAALLSMRAAAQRRDVAVRVALGAGRARIARQAIIDSVLLGAAGAGAGVLVAHGLLGLLKQYAPENIPRIEDAAVNVPVLGFCALALLAWVMVFGTVPIWNYPRRTASPVSDAAELSHRGSARTSGLRVFTIAEIAAAVVVTIAAALLLRSFVQLSGVDRGFDSDRLGLVSLLLPDQRYADARSRLAFYEQLLPHLEALPGVVSASPVHLEPGTGLVGLSAPMIFEGQTPEEATTNAWASWEPVMPSYFRTLGIPIVRGRGFTSADSGDGAPVAIVSESVAQRYWPGQDPIGKRLQFTPQFPWATVVGVAAEMRYRELTKTWLTVYFPAAQFFFFAPGSLLVRAESAPEALMAAILQTIHAREPYAAVQSVAAMDELLAKELARPRAALGVAALFAFMAVVLAAIGVYAVLAYEVRQRRRELAIRSALGASPSTIFRSVLARSLGLGAAGTAAGLAGAWMLTRSLQTLLFEVRPADPGAFVTGAAALLAVVLVAAYLPAKRASSVEPATVLRTE